MNVTQLVPREETVDLDGLTAALSNPSARLTPFSEAILDFCAKFSTVLFRDRDARRYPELQALAFWMRKAELQRFRDEFRSLETPSTLLVPRGLVFHVAPSNVDTIFVYSWIVSVLSGNANVIRISERAAEASTLICKLFNETLASSDSPLAANTSILRYGHDSAVNARLSAVADVRVIWGGDASVAALRAFPLQPHAKEITFPDRHSLAVAHAAQYLNLGAEQKRDLASKFFADTFWFDQMACSSPRLLIWTGSDPDCEAAAIAFFEFLEAEIEKREYTLATGPRLNKLTFAYRAALDRPVASLRTAGPECTVLELEDISNFDREHCGGGLLFQARTGELGDIAAMITRRDQTVAYFGFNADQLKDLSKILNGRGVDRFVPFGQALNFHRFWDGYDLLREFTRTVHIQT